MYESRKNMGDVHKDVSSAIKERKDVLSEEHEHDRDSEPRLDETEFHLSDPTELGIEDYVVLRDLGKVIGTSIVACYKNYRQKFEEELKGVTK